MSVGKSVTRSRYAGGGNSSRSSRCAVVCSLTRGWTWCAAESADVVQASGAASVGGQLPRRRLARQNLDLIVFGEQVRSADSLAGKASGSAPHPSTDAVVRELAVDDARDVDNRHGRPKRDRIAGQVRAESRHDADQSGERPNR